METTLRLATKEDIPKVWLIILQAKQQLKRQGSDQWQTGYPTQETLRDDIIKERAYVLCLNGKVIAYAAVVFTGEPVYENLEGKWLSDQSYVVIHRLAVEDDYKHRGVAKQMIIQVESLAVSQGVYSFRVDTHAKNEFMQRLLKSLWFVYCGKIRYEQGERMAFEKILSPRRKMV